MTPLVQTPGLVRRIRYSFESLGWRRSAQELVTSRRPYRPEIDTSFDVQHGTDTAGAVPTEELGIADVTARDGAIRYLPSPPRVTNWMLDRLPRGPAGATFVDLGCGKGRVVLLAAQRPFDRVIGVEISSELATVAETNVVRYRPPTALLAEVEIINADATALDLPAGDLVLHLYHPFEPAIFAAVLQRLGRGAAADDRHVTVAYLAYTAAIEPVAQVLATIPWLRLRRYEQSVRGHYNWLVYTSDGNDTVNDA